MAFTPAQEQAIHATNRELLVSAAAGSGKTSVLVERILRMIAQDGLSVSNMLIVTFTRAAAGEMRERLERRLAEAGQNNARLQQESEKVAGAQISTIHAFCQQVVRQHFQHCQIDPQFGLCDERTRAAFYRDSMEETLDWLYQAAGEDEGIRALTRKFAEKEIAAMVEGLYRFAMSRPDPMDYLLQSAHKRYALATLNDEVLAQAFCREAGLMIDAMQSLWQEGMALSENPAFPQKYLVTLQLDGALFNDLKRACDAGLVQLLRQMAGLTFSTLLRFTPSTGDEAQAAAAFKALRDRWKALFKELQALLPPSAEGALADLAVMHPATLGLCKAVLHFHDVFSGKKRDRAVIDFTDLEHMTLSVLREPALALLWQNRFDAIFVDEYQDVSALQEALLNALKRPKGAERPQSTFYVGDVKQSIYRFRLAEPRLFLGKLNRFSADETAEERKIVLNRNFRSKTEVLSAVNRVFAHVMDSRVTEIDYEADAMLVPGMPSVGDPACEVHVMNGTRLRSSDATGAEAAFIARDILEKLGKPTVMGDGTPGPALRFGDIAILMRAAKGAAPVVEQVLRDAGIPVYCEGATDALKSQEVDQVMRLLQLLQNPMNDVALLSVLRSLLFAMTERELADIRLCKPERAASYLAALTACAQGGAEPLKARCQAVLAALEQERFASANMPLSSYLWDVFTRTGLYAHYGAQPGGQQKQANLRMLCARAQDYETAHFDGLAGFVESLLVDSASPETSPAILNPAENVVRIMTIHKSKGLEFPTVYVMGMGHSLLGPDDGKNLRMDGDMGFALPYVNEQARTKRQTLLQNAIKLCERNAERAEAARVLYVALTRAKSRLVMVGTLKAEADAVRQMAQGGTDAFAVRSAKSMLEWVLQAANEGDAFSTAEALKKGDEGTFSTVSTGFPQKTGVWDIVFHNEPTLQPKTAGQADRLSPLLAGLDVKPSALGDAPHPAKGWEQTGLGGEHPSATAEAVLHPPVKVSVTALCKATTLSDMADGEETAETKRIPFAPQPRLLPETPVLPAFLQEAPEGDAALQTGIETHRLLGLLDLGYLKLVQGRHLREALQTMVQLYCAKGIVTEAQAAHMDVDMVARFFESPLGARVLESPEVHREWAFNLHITQPFDTLVQGVLDLCFLEHGQWVLVDFKTDRVRTAAELCPRYRRQMDYYAMALEKGTPYPVKERLLFALRLGEAVNVSKE